MKRSRKAPLQSPEQLISQSPDPSPAQMEFRIKRVWDRVQSEIGDQPVEVAFVPDRRSRLPRLALVLSAAVLIGIFVLLPAVLGPRLWRHDPPAIAETVGGGLARISANASRTIDSGTPIQFGQTIRSNSGVGAAFVLADKSRVEMRPNSQLVLERASDGVRIRLDSGSVLVSASKQRTGHLYVQTKDVTVSVVGTVFLVNAEKAGSRVAVIQGEVQVQEGTVVKKLNPGDQVATNPLMDPHPVREEIAWSPSAPTHLALLERQQSVAAPRMEFEAAVVKQLGIGMARPNLACKGTDGMLSIIRLAGGLGDGGVDASTVPQGRCVGVAFLREMIAAAFEVSSNRVSGDRPVLYAVEAKADDPETATKEHLQQMFQNFVVDQFKLKAHRETEEDDGYVLRVGKRASKLKEASGDEEPPHSLRRPGPVALDQPLPTTIECKCTLKTFANYLPGVIGGATVIDRTDLSGLYEIHLTLNRLPSDGGPRGSGSGNRYDPPLPDALEDQLGLRLESRRVPVEYLVVDHIEMPTTN